MLRPILGTVVLVVFASALLSAEQHKLYRPPHSVLLYVFADPDGLRLASPNGDIVVKPPIQIGTTWGALSLPALSPKGDLVAWGFAVRMNSHADVLHRARFVLGVYSVKTKQWRTFGDFDHVAAAAFSPDGSSVAFVVEQDRQYTAQILHIATEGIKVVHPRLKKNEALAGSFLSWSPDSRSLAVVITDGERRSPMIMDLESGSVQPLASGDSYLAVWSPNGKWLVYSRGDEVVVAHADGTRPRTILKVRDTLFGTARYVRGPIVWSPDATSVLVNVGRGESQNDIVLVDLERGIRSRKIRNGPVVFGWAPAN
jgi:dipeptidyl aminopeptidase/acylaminoacyl peptidase